MGVTHYFARLKIIGTGTPPISHDAIFDLSAEQLLASQIADADLGRLTVHEHAGYRWLRTQDSAVQSIMRIESPAEPVLPNHIAMLIGLLFPASPQRILNLGVGIGSFERFIHTRLPAIDIVSVDNDPILVELAREHFCVPHEWPVFIQSAEDYLEQTDLTFDTIFCDLFVGDSHAPCLFDAYFYSTAARHLTEMGILSLNLYPRSEQDMVSILLAVRQSFPWVMLMKIPRHGNIVLLACLQPPPSDMTLLERARQRATTLKLDFGDLLQHLERLPPPAS